jgi:hypothetical protein
MTLTEVHVVALNASGEVSEGEEFIPVGIAIVLADCNQVGFGQEVKGFLGGCSDRVRKLGENIVDGVDGGK